MPNSGSISKSEFLVNSKYRLAEKIGRGSFGDVFLGTDIENGEKVAVKLESRKSKSQQLLNEYNMYELIIPVKGKKLYPGEEALLQGGFGCPRIKWFGEEKGYNTLVMDVLGPNLEELFTSCNRRFTLKTILLLADQMIDILDYIHHKGVIHRDINPKNFLMGKDQYSDRVYLVDFGLAHTYRDNDTREHIPYCEGKAMVGTPRFASISAHLGCQQSRRDDLESLGFVLMYFLRGSLPWQGLKPKPATKEETYMEIGEIKMSTSTLNLCGGYEYEFMKYLRYCRRLRFRDAPDYDGLQKLFGSLFYRNNFKPDYVYDWTIIKQDIDAKSAQAVRQGRQKGVEHP